MTSCSSRRRDKWSETKKIIIQRHDQSCNQVMLYFAQLHHAIFLNVTLVMKLPF